MSKNNVTIIGIILLVALATAFVYFWQVANPVSNALQENNKTIEQENNSNVAEVNTEVNTSDLSVKTLATGDWQTYRSEFWGYTVQYPTYWSIIDSDDEGVLTVLSYQDTVINIGMGFGQGTTLTRQDNPIKTLNGKNFETYNFVDDAGQVRIQGATLDDTSLPQTFAFDIEAKSDDPLSDSAIADYNKIFETFVFE